MGPAGTVAARRPLGAGGRRGDGPAMTSLATVGGGPAATYAAAEYHLMGGAAHDQLQSKCEQLIAMDEREIAETYFKASGFHAAPAAAQAEAERKAARLSTKRAATLGRGLTGKYSEPDASGGPGAARAPRAPEVKYQRSFKKTSFTETTKVLAISDQCPLTLRLSPSHRWEAKSFKLQKAIGWGRASTIYSSTAKATGQQLVLKIYTKELLKPLHFEQVNREISIHSRLKHPNILQMYAAFEDEHSIYLVLEYAAEGDVFTRFQHSFFKSTQDKKFVRTYLYPLLTAVKYLHSMGIVHRDIKPENVLLCKGSVVKLADFGLALDTTTESPRTRLGTLDYMAPEVVRIPPNEKIPISECYAPGRAKRLQALYNHKVDVWAVGIFCFEMMASASPFGSQLHDQDALVQNILHKSNLEFPKSMSTNCKDFIGKVLVKSPAKRPSIAQLLSHPFLTSNIEADRLPKKTLHRLLTRSSILPFLQTECTTAAQHRAADEDRPSAKGAPGAHRAPAAGGTKWRPNALRKARNVEHPPSPSSVLALL